MSPTIFDEIPVKRKHVHYVGTQGSCDCPYSERETISSTMPWSSIDIYSKPKESLTDNQKGKLWLFNKRQEEIKRAWKRDQYANVRGQIRI